MPQDQSIQSLDRGLAILRYLAEHQNVTASQVGKALDIHQSSASRLLNSLLKAGFVKKPHYHKFILDYGALEFAGLAMNSLPAVQASYKVCNHIANQTGLNVSVGILRNDSLLYLTQNDLDCDLGLRFLSNKKMPLHQSSLGCVLSWALGKNKGRTLLKKSFILCHEDNQSQELFDSIDSSMQKHNLFWFAKQKGSLFNAAIPITLDGEQAAIAIYSRTKKSTIAMVQQILQQCRDILLE
jgi:DNA-binding IclR family transcriptional regulator